MSLAFENTEQALVFFINKMPDFFQHQHVVAFLFGLLSQVYQGLEKLIHIGNIIVAGQHQVSGHPVVLAQKGVNIFQAVSTVCAIAQMPQ